MVGPGAGLGDRRNILETSSTHNRLKTGTCCAHAVRAEPTHCRRTQPSPATLSLLPHPAHTCLGRKGRSSGAESPLQYPASLSPTPTWTAQPTKPTGLKPPQPQGGSENTSSRKPPQLPKPGSESSSLSQAPHPLHAMTQQHALPYTTVYHRRHIFRHPLKHLETRAGLSAWHKVGGSKRMTEKGANRSTSESKKEGRKGLPWGLGGEEPSGQCRRCGASS